MDFLSRKAREITPYVAGEQPKEQNVIKLNTNENPYPPSKTVEEFLKNVEINLFKKYPNANADAIRREIAKRNEIDDSNVFIGNGSDDVLAHAFLAFFQGKKVATFDVTYSFYPVYAKLFDVNLTEIPVKEDFTLDLEKLDETEKDAVIIANPNAPTSIEEKRENIMKLVEKSPETLFVVDEAYSDFGTESVLDETKNHPNLLVIRTFSKSYSLAGLRVGYAVGAKEVIDGLNRIKNSFNSYPVNYLSAEIARLSYLDEEYFEETTARIVKTRERLSLQLKELGFKVLPSAANFVFAKSDKASAKELYEKLKKNGIYVRYFDKKRIDDYLRISVGTDEETDAIINKIKELI